MQLIKTYDHHGGTHSWQNAGMLNWLSETFNAPQVKIGPASTTQIREHVDNELLKSGWALNSQVSSDSQLTITAKWKKLGFQIQTGNISRAAYDLLKLQTMYLSRDIDAGCLAVPTLNASKIIGGNLANSDRIYTELQTFNRHITIPLVLVSFE